MKPDEPEAVKVLFDKLMRKPLRTFPKLRKSLHAPCLQGVYVIHDPRGRDVLHVGRTHRAKGGIAQRLKDHLGSRSSFVRGYKPLEGDGSRLRQGKFKFRYLAVDSPRQRALLEAHATGHLCPAHLGEG